MKAWRIKENEIVLDEIEAEGVTDSCVKVKLLYCSVAVTDRLVAAGGIKAELPIIPGRQAVGMVVETGTEVKNCVRGDIVAIKPIKVCGQCAKCIDNKHTECESPLVFGLTESGFLRDFAVVSSDAVVKLPERVAAKDAVFVDYIDIAIETVSKSELEKGQYLVICGATQLGLILAQVAMYYQIIPILADINPSFLQTAEELGIYYTINSSETDTKKQVFMLTGGKLADVVAYMADSSYPFAHALDLVKNGGKIAVCGLEKSCDGLHATLCGALNRRLSIYGIAESNKHILSAVNMLASKTLNVEPLIAKEIDFSAVRDELKKEINPATVYFKTLVKI